MLIRKANGCIHYTCKLAGSSSTFPLTYINREKDKTSTTHNIASFNTNLNLEQCTFSSSFARESLDLTNILLPTALPQVT